MIPRKKLKNRIDWIRRRRVLVKGRCFYLRWSILQELFQVCMAGALAFFVFAMLVVALIAECVVSKGSLSGIGRIVVLLILISSAVFATAQFRYASVDEKRDSYMQYMTDEKSVIVWGKIYKTEYKYFSYRYYMTDCVVQPGYGKAFGRKISCGDVVVYCDSKSAHLGDYMKANGKIGLFKSATNEGEFDRARFYRSQGIGFLGECRQY